MIIDLFLIEDFVMLVNHVIFISHSLNQGSFIVHMKTFIIQLFVKMMIGRLLLFIKDFDSEKWKKKKENFQNNDICDWVCHCHCHRMSFGSLPPPPPEEPMKSWKIYENCHEYAIDGWWQAFFMLNTWTWMNEWINEIK